jgi:hypothetical protein
VNTIEDGARAAMREIAETVTGAPPLHLDPARLEVPQSAEARMADQRALRALPTAANLAASGRPDPRRARRFRAWLPPLTAAAAVVAVAASLVALKIHPNGTVVPRSAPASVPAGSVPRYFAELDPALGKVQGGPSGGVLIADTYTGKRVATVAPPAGITFTSVSAASDDRTFVLFATPSGKGTHLTGTWYELRIAPGTAHPATLTRLPLKAMPGVDAMAVSGSGRELAVVQAPALETQSDVLSIYALATGHLVHAWTTPWASRVLPYFATNVTGPLADWPVLTWVDGDRGIIFPGQPLPTNNDPPFTWKMWRLDVSAKGSSLGADSKVVWTEQTPASGRDKYGCDLENPLAVSPNGRTFVCASRNPAANGLKLMKWVALVPGRNPPNRLLYQTKSNLGSGSSGYGGGFSDDDVVLWTNQTGSTVIALWYRLNFSGTGSPTTALYFGVISNGKFHALPASLITTPTLYSPTAIAW